MVLRLNNASPVLRLYDHVYVNAKWEYLGAIYGLGEVNAEQWTFRLFWLASCVGVSIEGSEVWRILCQLPSLVAYIRML